MNALKDPVFIGMSIFGVILLVGYFSNKMTNKRTDSCSSQNGQSIDCKQKESKSSGSSCCGACTKTKE